MDVLEQGGPARSGCGTLLDDRPAEDLGPVSSQPLLRGAVQGPQHPGPPHPLSFSI